MKIYNNLELFIKENPEISIYILNMIFECITSKQSANQLIEEHIKNNLQHRDKFISKKG